MIKTRFFPPYNKDGTTNLRKFVGRSGVYIIRRENDPKIMYIGYSETNLYKTILRHFQSWDDNTQVRTTYPKYGYSLRIVLCSPAKAATLESALIKKYSGSDNPMKLKGKQTRREWAILEEYEDKPVTNYSDIETPF